MPSQLEIRKSITDRIIEALKNDLPPWRMPWRCDPNAGFPTNIVSKRKYRGINILLLQLASHRHGFTSRHFGTFSQWQSIGGKIMRRPADVPAGSWGCSIIFYKSYTKIEVDKDGNEEEKNFYLMRTYTVFCADQVRGVDHLRCSEDEPQSDFPADYQHAETAVAVTGADIRFGGERAFYNRSEDYIQCPHKGKFDSVEDYYETILHELVHWTEPRQRLDWHGRYSLAELRAEIGSCFLANELGIPVAENLGNHAAYLKSWLQAMQGDPKFVFKASSQASKAVDFILAFSREPVLAG